MPIVNVKTNNTYTADAFFQYDANRVLEIYGLNLSTLPEIHFANAKMDKAIVKQAADNGNGGYTVEVPNVLLETAFPIRVFVCTHDGEEFISRCAFTLNVKARPKPEDYIAGDDEKIYSYTALENLVNNTLVNLRAENETFRAELVEQMENIIAGAQVGDADTLDGYHAEDFEISCKPGRTVFNADGSITTLYYDGSSETTVFNSDGSISTTYNTLEIGQKVERVSFNTDGSITVTVN